VLKAAADEASPKVDDIEGGLDEEGQRIDSLLTDDMGLGADAIGLDA